MISQESYEPIIYVSTIFAGEPSEFNSLLLAESIRRNGGKLASSPIWFFSPENQSNFSEMTLKWLEALNIRLIPFNLDSNVQQIFFLREVEALTKAEELINGQAEIMIWMDSNTLVLKEPTHCMLPANKQLGYKPVHHLLLGSRYEDELDPFWKEVYSFCKVNQERIFPMKPMIEDIQMKPYFNAGFLVTSPEYSLIANWSAFFKEAIQNPTFTEFMKHDHRYEIFLHQAILSAVILNQFEPSQLLELPGSYNYPLHLWLEDHTNRRPSSLEHCITIRHEGLLKTKSWMTGGPFNKNQTDWLLDRIARYQN